MKNLQLKLKLCLLMIVLIPVFSKGQKIEKSQQDRFTKDYFIIASVYPTHKNCLSCYNYKCWSISSLNSRIGFTWSESLFFQGDISVGDKLLISLENGTTLTFVSTDNRNAEFHKQADQTVQNTTYNPGYYVIPATSTSTSTTIEGNSWYECNGQYANLSYTDIQKLASSRTAYMRIIFKNGRTYDAIDDKTPHKIGKKMMKLAKVFLKEYDRVNKNKDVTPIKNGVAKEYYEDGKLKSETPYTDNEINGVAKGYFENGNLQWEATYVNGKKTNVKYYNANGSGK